MTTIKSFDYLKQYENLREEVLTAIDNVLKSGQLILGQEVQQFEEEFAQFIGGGYCVGVNSGTDALEIALRALEIGLGDEVITVSNTAVPTVSAIRSVGAIPVFCDVDPETCLMNLSELSRHITEKTRAIIPVHLFGNVVDVPMIRDIIGKRDIKIIEDCAQAHGAKLRGKMAGTMGDIGAFSFYPTKNLGAYGDSGVCYSSKSALIERMRSIRMYGFEGSYYSMREGINSRMDEIQAAILYVKLKYLPDYIERRRKLAEIYQQNLIEKAVPIRPADGVSHAYHLFVVNVPCRDNVQNELFRRGISTGIHYPYPIHLMPAYRFLGYKEGDLPHTEALAKNILSLPIYPELSDESVRKICGELKDVITQ
jgi:dTDP-4-amino-4,6-dideoxygalactose transaminase